MDLERARRHKRLRKQALCKFRPRCGIKMEYISSCGDRWYKLMFTSPSGTTMLCFSHSWAVFFFLWGFISWYGFQNCLQHVCVKPHITFISTCQKDLIGLPDQALRLLFSEALRSYMAQLLFSPCLLKDLPPSPEAWWDAHPGVLQASLRRLSVAPCRAWQVDITASVWCSDVLAG